jgi:hypothetical protein
MSAQHRDPAVVTVSQMVYSLLLRTYPSGFRREYATHMAQVFRDCCLRAHHMHGLPGMLSLWATISLDYFQSVLSEHIQKGVHMSKQRFIQVSNWSLMMGAIALILGISASTFSNGPYDPYNFASRPIDRILEPASFTLIPAALLLISIGVAGLYVRFAQDGSTSCKACLALSFLGGIFAFIFFLGMLTIENDLFWQVMMYAATMLFFGLFLFGILATLQGLHVRASWLLTLAGTYVPSLLLVSTVYELLGGGWLEVNEVLDLAGLLITGGSLFAFAYLQRQVLREPQLSPA